MPDQSLRTPPPDLAPQSPAAAVERFIRLIGHSLGGIVDLSKMTERTVWIEVQASAEDAPFSREHLEAMLEIGTAAIRRIFEIQRPAAGI